MLLLYVVLFLNILVARPGKLTLGWTGKDGTPWLGGLYWVTPASFGEPPGNRGACVVLFRLHSERKIYRVARMHSHKSKSKPRGALRATRFFGKLAKIQTRTSRVPMSLDRYYIDPQELYDVEGHPEVMGLYDWDLRVMSEINLNILVTLSIGLVPGWDELVQNGPKLGGVYWIRPSHLGINLKGEAIYKSMPCIILRWLNQVGDKYMWHVVRISRGTLSGEKPVHAMEFFDSDVKLKIASGPGGAVVGLQNYYIFPHKRYEVLGDPKIMRVWSGNKFLTIMKEEDLARLVAASRMVDGWVAGQGVPLLGGVYWIRPQDLDDKLKAKYGVYTPCVVIGRVGNKYRVVKISLQFGQSARMYFAKDAMLQTPTGITDVTKYYLHPSYHYDVKDDPQIIQRCEEGVIIQVLRSGMKRLEKHVFPEEDTDGHVDKRPRIT